MFWGGHVSSKQIFDFQQLLDPQCLKFLTAYKLWCSTDTDVTTVNWSEISTASPLCLISSAHWLVIRSILSESIMHLFFRLRDWLIDWETHSTCQVARYVDRLIGWLMGWIGWLPGSLIDKLTGWLIDWQIDWLIGWLVDWLTDWPTGWLQIDWLTDWLTGCLAAAIWWPTQQKHSKTKCFNFVSLFSVTRNWVKKLTCLWNKVDLQLKAWRSTNSITELGTVYCSPGTENTLCLQ